jgi:ribonuclease BN (tRNA processing enzyme)
MSELIIVGAGSAFNAKAGHCSALIKSGKAGVLLDCGALVPFALQDAGLIDDVTHVLVSHGHADHIGGIEPLAQIRYFVSLKGYPLMGKPSVPVPALVAPQRMIDVLRTEEVRGLGKIQDDFGRPLNATLETYFDLDVIEAFSTFCPEGADDMLGLRYLHADHVPGDFPAYSFEVIASQPYRSQRRILWSADTRVPLRVDGYDLVFHDCQLFQGPNRGGGDVHAYFDDLVAAIPPEQRGKVWLMHFGKNVDAWREKAAEAGFAGFAQPGQRFDLRTCTPIDA